ncbi:MAG TPA: bifunctional DNA-formamidopyrimidine glycosylase/DNA-(apurinic or apyrimidinic site) lyase [Candidatus Baltobacteraceae bacterium]|nr:bifunctional DNA-formamidopyrimidine glycosylase/DNA-(apurinic or apyrimidinic site) lyase [Candidatus Baltobacteraceae bacterium]
MPELPEVETIVRGLRPAIAGKTIASVRVSLKKMAVAPSGVQFERALAGETIVDVTRRGKYAVFGLSSGRSLVTSLRMTGRLVVLNAAEQPYPYTHVELRFSDESRLAFADVRQFGRMRLVEPGEPWDADLGVEPLSRDFTPERFIGMLSGRTTPVKVFLLDQRRIAGVGNIYACEALWQAGIRPGTPAKRLSKPAAVRLHHALVDVLQRAIGMRGSSVDDYVDAQGLKGGFQNVLSVYGRTGKSCGRCGGSIVRTVIAQRGTWWCRACQK